MKSRWLALIWLSLLPTAVTGQVAEVGDRVRVRTTDRERHVGALAEITPTDVILTSVDGGRRIALDRINTVERSQGRQRRFVRNLFITTGVGALALGAVAFGAELGNEHCGDGPFGCMDPGGAFVLGSIVGAVYSLPIGLIVGLAVRSERWQPVSLVLPAGAAAAPPFGTPRVRVGASVAVGPRANVRRSPGR